MPQNEYDPDSRCLNCDTLFTGNFCCECGQPASTERYRLPALGREILVYLRKIDTSTTLRTFHLLLTKPGEFVRSYLSGRRVGYLGPVRFFFHSFLIALTVGGSVYWLTHNVALAYQTSFDLRLELVTFASTIFWGLLWALFYRHSGLNLAENIVAAIYFVAQANFHSTILQLLTLPILSIYGDYSRYATGVDTLLTMAYSFYFAKGLFGESLSTVVPKQLVLSILHLLLLSMAFYSGAFFQFILDTAARAFN